MPFGPITVSAPCSFIESVIFGEDQVKIELRVSILDGQ